MSDITMGLDSVELVLTVEETFSIEIPDRVAEKLVTVGKLHEYVVFEIHRCERTGPSAEAVFDTLREIICAQLAVPPERVTPEARFVEDLKID